MSKEKLTDFVDAFEVVRTLLCETCKTKVDEYFERLKNTKLDKLKSEILSL